MFGMLQSLLSLGKLASNQVDASTILHVAKLASVSVDEKHAELAASVIRNEGGVGDTLATWLGEPGNPARLLKLVMGGKDEAVVHRCPHCQTSFML